MTNPQATADKPATPAVQPVVVPLANVEPVAICWLWPGRIARGKLTLLVGDPGVGKSLLTLDLAARVSAGNDWSDGQAMPDGAGGVMLLNAEDDLADTVRPRLDAAGADVGCIVALQAIRRVDKNGKPRERSVSLADLPEIEAAIQQVPDCRLVIIDPISAYMGGTDSHVNTDVRALLGPMGELAARCGVAIVAVTHLRKGEGPAVYRAMGSLAFVAAARGAIAVAKDPGDPSGGRRLMLSMKNNLAADTTGLAYTVQSGATGAPVVDWNPEPVHISVDDVLAPPPRQRGRPSAERDRAAAFLQEYLASGARLATDIEQAAKGAGISAGTLKRARAQAGVITYQPVNPGPWWWRWGEGAGAHNGNGQHRAPEFCTSAPRPGRPQEHGSGGPPE